MNAPRVVGALSILALVGACQSAPRAAEAAEVATKKLVQEGVKEISLTPTQGDEGQFLFQVEGKRAGKAVVGAAEVSYEATEPGVALHLFELSPEGGAVTAQSR